MSMSSTLSGSALSSQRPLLSRLKLTVSESVSKLINRITNSPDQPNFLLTAGLQPTPLPVVPEEINEAVLPADINQAANRILDVMNAFLKAQPGKHRREHRGSLKCYFTAPEKAWFLFKDKNKIAAGQELEKIFIRTQSAEQTTIAYREGKRPENNQQLDKILYLFKVVNKGSSLTANLKKVFTKDVNFQQTSFAQQQAHKAIRKASESQSHGDYGRIKEKLRANYLTFCKFPSPDTRRDFNSALQQFTKYLLKTQATNNWVQKEAGKITGGAGEEYNSGFNTFLEKRTLPHEAISTIERTLRKAEAQAGESSKEGDIVLPEEYGKAIKNTVHGITKSTLINMAQQFDNAWLCEKMQKVSQNNHASPVASLKEYKNIQQKFAASFNHIVDTILPRNEQQQLRKELEKEFNAIQVGNQQNLEAHSVQILSDRRQALEEKLIAMFDNAQKRNLTGRARALTPQWFKEVFNIQGSSLATNNRIQGAIHQVKDTYKVEATALGKQAVDLYIEIEAAKAKRNAALNTGAKVTTQQMNEDIKKKAGILACDFINGLPGIKNIVEQGREKLIDKPGIIKSLFKPFSSGTNILNKVAALLIGAGILVVTVSAAAGIVMTGIILPLAGVAGITIGVCILLPAYIKIFNERAEMQAICKSTKQSSKAAEKIKQKILFDIKYYAEKYVLQ